MADAIKDLEHRIRRKFGRVSSLQYEQIAGNFRTLIANGLQSEADLPEMALDPSSDPSVRAIACWFLARLSSRRVSTPVLLRLLAGSPPMVRVEAARSLGIIRSKKALPTLVDMALHERDKLVRESSVEALGLLQDKRCLDTLLSIARHQQEPPALRGLAIEQLGSLGASTPDVLQTLRALLQDEPPEVSFWAIHALGELADESLVPALQTIAVTDGTALQPFGMLRDKAWAAIEQIRSRERLSRTSSSES